MLQKIQSSVGQTHSPFQGRLSASALQNPEFSRAPNIDHIRFSAETASPIRLPELSLAELDRDPAGFGKKLLNAWATHGAVSIDMSGVKSGEALSSELVARHYQNFQAFLALPEDVKKQYTQNMFNGYRIFQNAKNPTVYQSQIFSGPTQSYLPTGKTLEPEMAAFAETNRDIDRRLSAIAVKLADALGLALGDGGYLKSLVSDDAGNSTANNMNRTIFYAAMPQDVMDKTIADRKKLTLPWFLRWLKYTRLPGMVEAMKKLTITEDGQAVRLSGHQDPSLFTIAPEATLSGLEICGQAVDISKSLSEFKLILKGAIQGKRALEDSMVTTERELLKREQVIDAEVQKDHIVVMPGKLLQMITEGAIEATMHRVTTKPGRKEDRLTMAYFVLPAFAKMAEVPKTLRGEPAQEKTFGESFLDYLRNIGGKVCDVKSLEEIAR